ncbi:MAG TPA: radical SAM protein [Acidimicrobiia bacterium]|nr:radical SAM protein [Acidimicrobiia bacterium]
MTGGRRVRRSVIAYCPACHRSNPEQPLDQVRRLPAQLEDDGRVWLTRTCPDHGRLETLYEEVASILDYLEQWTTRPDRGTPDDPGNDGPLPAGYLRGLGARQLQHTCILLEDVTNACNLRCPTCFAVSGPDSGRMIPIADVLASVDQRLAREGGKLDVVMVSGGEPTLHPDLLPLLEGLAERNIVRILLNTNGLRLARDDELLGYLAEHCDHIELYLQFDGFRPATWRHHRGCDLRRVKERIVARVSSAEVFATLVMTAALGVNHDEMGAVVSYALETPFVGGVCIQPVIGSGRGTGIDPRRRLTHTGVLARLGTQTGGVVTWQDLIALPCSHPHCASVGYMVQTDDGRWRSLVSIVGQEQLAAHLGLISDRIVDPSITRELRSLVSESLKGVLRRGSSLADPGIRELFRNVNDVCDLRIGALIHSAAKLTRDQDRLRRLLATRVKRLQVKPFMDIDTMIEERLLQCCVHVGSRSGDRHQCQSFCAAQAWPELSATKLSLAGPAAGQPVPSPVIT